MRYMIVTGNPIDGFRFFGPFATRSEAVDNVVGDDWWLARIEEPSELNN